MSVAALPVMDASLQTVYCRRRLRLGTLVKGGAAWSLNQATHPKPAPIAVHAHVSGWERHCFLLLIA